MKKIKQVNLNKLESSLEFPRDKDLALELLVSTVENKGINTREIFRKKVLKNLLQALE